MQSAPSTNPDAKNLPPKKTAPNRELELGSSYDELPDWAREGMKRYIERSIKPGDALTGVLTNSLSRAMGHWSRSWDELRIVQLWVYNAVPGPAWGSVEAVNEWLEFREFVGESDGDN